MMLDKIQESGKNLKPIEGLQGILSSNNLSDCNPSLVFTNEEKEELLLDKLSDILLEIYITKKKNENINRAIKKESSSLHKGF